jgi:hypothetical protein
MSGGDNLVGDIMQQLERQNGSYNEETGDFSKKSPGGQGLGDGQSFESLQQQFLSILHRNEELKGLIDSSPKYHKVIEEILGHEEFLKDLLNDPSIIPGVITSILNGQEEEEKKAQAQAPAPPPSAPKPVVAPLEGSLNSGNDFSLSDVKINPQLSVRTPPAVSTGGEFSWGEFLSGPAIAMICYFLVSNTPLLHYLGQIPYVGGLLIGNKMITSLFMTGVLFVIFSVIVEFTGLI